MSPFLCLLQLLYKGVFLPTQMWLLKNHLDWGRLQFVHSVNTVQEGKVHSLSHHSVHCRAEIIPMEACGTLEQMQNNPPSTTQHCVKHIIELVFLLKYEDLLRKLTKAQGHLTSSPFGVLAPLTESSHKCSTTCDLIWSPWIISGFVYKILSCDNLLLVARKTRSLNCSSARLILSTGCMNSHH